MDEEPLEIICAGCGAAPAGEFSIYCDDCHWQSIEIEEGEWDDD